MRQCLVKPLCSRCLLNRKLQGSRRVLFTKCLYKLKHRLRCALKTRQLCFSTRTKIKRADANYSPLQLKRMSHLFTIMVKVQPPWRAKLLRWIFCIIKWVSLESKMVFFFFLLFLFSVGLTHTLLPTARDKVGVHCDMMKWLYLFCKRSAGWLRET